jgi:polar amino acid transport system substrate-binding protein
MLRIIDFSRKLKLNALPLPDRLAIAVLLLYALIVLLANTTLGAAPLDRTWARVLADGQVRVAVDVGFRPFTDLQDGDIVGYDIDLVSALADKLGLQVAFVPTGFDALYDSLQSGRADVVASALPYAPEQGFRARFSSVYFDAGLVLLVPATAPLAGIDDLAGRRLGVALGSSADAFARRIAGVALRNRFETPDAVVTALRQGHIDAAIVDNVTALTAVQRRPGLRIATALSSEPYVLAVPADAFRLEAELNTALEELRAEGFFEELNRKWFR